jgi:hypothetical protein
MPGSQAMPSYSPELIQTMRAALDEVMTKIPVEQATPGIKAALAECILKAAADGQTKYDGLIAAASGDAAFRDAVVNESQMQKDILLRRTLNPSSSFNTYP